MPTPTEYSLLSMQLSFTGGHLQSIAPSLYLINISLKMSVCSIGKLVRPTPTEHSLLSNFIHWWTPAEVTYPLAPSLCIVKQFICHFLCIGMLVMSTTAGLSFINWWTPAEVASPLAPCISLQLTIYYCCS